MRYLTIMGRAPQTYRRSFAIRCASAVVCSFRVRDVGCARWGSVGLSSVYLPYPTLVLRGQIGVWRWQIGPDVREVLKRRKLLYQSMYRVCGVFSPMPAPPGLSIAQHGVWLQAASYASMRNGWVRHSLYARAGAILTVFLVRNFREEGCSATKLYSIGALSWISRRMTMQSSRPPRILSMAGSASEERGTAKVRQVLFNTRGDLSSHSEWFPCKACLLVCSIS